jgi:hypothetical protein|tara:strand:+ start:2056 stop:2301 length:246 start_codon:yes stop_codon:yes gene_type:complete
MTANNIHPMTQDLSELSTSEVEAKVNELRKKYLSARNPEIKNQIFYFLTDYQEELKMRYAKEKLEMDKQTGNDLDNLINID